MATFGESLRDTLKAAADAKRAAGGKFGWDDMPEIIDHAYRLHCQSHRKTYHPIASEGPVDPCFDALALAEGSEPKDLTPEGKRRVAIALAQIRKVAPDVSPDEIRRRGNVHKSRFKWSCTANSVAVHWAKLNGFHHLTDPKPMPEATERPPNIFADLVRQNGIRIE